MQLYDKKESISYIIIGFMFCSDKERFRVSKVYLVISCFRESLVWWQQLIPIKTNRDYRVTACPYW